MCGRSCKSEATEVHFAGPFRVDGVLPDSVVYDDASVIVLEQLSNNDLSKVILAESNLIGGTT